MNLAGNEWDGISDGALAALQGFGFTPFCNAFADLIGSEGAGTFVDEADRTRFWEVLWGVARECPAVLKSVSCRLADRVGGDHHLAVEGIRRFIDDAAPDGRRMKRRRHRLISSGR